jgi:hypothetical protein
LINRYVAEWQIANKGSRSMKVFISYHDNNMPFSLAY